ncbi:MAG: hypothetical protein IKI03_05345 [Clostridia bacterium]|nr:hypothetical protein [Clostridia bacterium]
MKVENHASFFGRSLEMHSHGVDPEWGYEKPQTDSFALIRPKDEKPGELYPLFVVFHSAGHDLYSTIRCMQTEGDHDIYHTPDDSFALVPDCRANMNDWWWGGISPEGAEEGMSDPRNYGTELRPVEKRILAEIAWVKDNCPVDPERVYAVGNSMGGSGCLGIGYRHGDIFAGIKANVPAGVVHTVERCALFDRPEGFTMPDPPVTVDYSSPCDQWSGGHEALYRGIFARKYPIIGFWGPFGHANNNFEIAKINDLIHSFDVFSIRLHDPYPVFSNASTDDPLPWPDDRGSNDNGQVNAFFRWKTLADTEEDFGIELRLLRPDEWESRETFPETSVADVSLRRRQAFLLRPGERFFWEYGDASGEAEADAEGLPTVPRVTITRTPRVLKLHK